jgi:hypothetical protein
VKPTGPEPDRSSATLSCAAARENAGDGFQVPVVVTSRAIDQVWSDA